ncbi:uncharacterized protein EDB91DRAFT_1105189, partial [Suillus paluster]|uniref:uncharacterized protein n=1 Tax=Suillus paluster TaxID=48578 RepID=UPI001B864EFB
MKVDTICVLFLSTLEGTAPEFLGASPARSKTRGFGCSIAVDALRVREGDAPNSDDRVVRKSSLSCRGYLGVTEGVIVYAALEKSTCGDVCMKC